MSVETKSATITRKEVVQYMISHTPEQVYDTTIAFCKDVENLTHAMSDLWRDNRVPLSMSNVKVEVKVTCDAADEPLIQAIIGADADVMGELFCEGEVQHEEG